MRIPVLTLLSLITIMIFSTCQKSIMTSPVDNRILGLWTEKGYHHTIKINENTIEQIVGFSLVYGSMVTDGTAEVSAQILPSGELFLSIDKLTGLSVSIDTGEDVQIHYFSTILNLDELQITLDPKEHDAYDIVSYDNLDSYDLILDLDKHLKSILPRLNSLINLNVN